LLKKDYHYSKVMFIFLNASRQLCGPTCLTF